MNKRDILYCPVCGSSEIYEQTYVNINTGEIDRGLLGEKLQEYNYMTCRGCYDQEIYPSDLKTIEQLWEDFEDVPFTPDDKLDDNFLDFQPGEATKLDIWEWFVKRWPEDIPNPTLAPLITQYKHN